MDLSSPYAFEGLTATSPATIYLTGQLTRYSESLEISSLPINSPPYLTYQFLRIMKARLSPFTPPAETLILTRDLLANLIHGPAGPLHHIFATLVATSLIDLTDRVETALEAQASIHEMDDQIAGGGIVARSVDGMGWDLSIRELLHQKKAPSQQQQQQQQQSSMGTTAVAAAVSSSADNNQSAEQEPNMAGLQHLAAAAVGEREGADAAQSGGAGVNRPASSSGAGAGAVSTSVTTAATATTMPFSLGCC